MRFITEFEREVISIPDAEFISNFPHVRKMSSEADLGQMISASFGWKENTVKMFSGKEMNRWSLEIEAFPMDKWIEFEKRFYDALPDYDVVSKTRLINALTSLMTFQGNPSGDTITNLSDQMEYRGPSSHCKACEDEAAGIKHIQAQRHTCKFKR